MSSNDLDRSGAQRDRFVPSGTLAVVGDPAADDLVNSDPTALLFAMLLDQQIPLGWAFAGPLRLSERLGHLDVLQIAAQPQDDIVEVATRKPAVHRFPAAMGKRIHALAAALVDDYDATPSAIWTDAADAHDLYERLTRLPGFGDEKAMITMAVLAKRFGIAPSGWEEVVGVFADDQPRSAADIYDDASRTAVHEWKRAQRDKGLDKQDRPLGGTATPA